MKIRLVSVFTMFFGLLLAGPQWAVSQESSAGSTLEVHLSYTGSGTVDDKHKIYVVLWDSPAFVSGGEVMPLELQPLTTKQGTVTFSNVKKSPAYVSAAYDPKGEWAGQSAPPDGSSLGLYSKTPGKPEPIDIEAGKAASIELSFDDSVKMQAGHATK